MIKSTNKNSLLLPAAGALLLTVFDQATKQAAQAALKGQEAFVVLNGVFELRYLENRGSAFGMLQGQRPFFLIMALAMLIFIPYAYTRIPKASRFHFLRIVAVLYWSGAAGNAVDRALHGYVVDFFYFSLIDFPIFNVADIYVTTATAALIGLIMFYYKEDDFAQIHFFSKHRQ